MHDVVELVITRQLLLYKSTNDLLVTVRKNQAGKGIVTPLDRADIINVELG